MVYLSSLYHLYPPKKTVWFNCFFSTGSGVDTGFHVTTHCATTVVPLKKPIRRSQRCPSRPSQPFARGGTRTTWPGISFTWHQWGQTMSQFVTMGLIMPGLDAQTPVKFSWESLHFHSDLDNRQLFFFCP